MELNSSVVIESSVTGSLIVAMIFFILLVILLKDNPDVMEKIIYIVGGVVIGAFGGYGFGKNRNDE